MLVDFDGGDLYRWAGTRHPDGGVAAQGPDLEDPLGADDLALDGEVFALGGCDPDVGEAVVKGVLESVLQGFVVGCG